MSADISVLHDIRKQSLALQRKCKKESGHNLNCDHMVAVGIIWIAPSKEGGGVELYENAMARCEFCGFTVAAHKPHGKSQVEGGGWQRGHRK